MLQIFSHHSHSLCRTVARSVCVQGGGASHARQILVCKVSCSAEGGGAGAGAAARSLSLTPSSPAGADPKEQKPPPPKLQHFARATPCRAEDERQSEWGRRQDAAGAGG